MQQYNVIIYGRLKKKLLRNKKEMHGKISGMKLKKIAKYYIEKSIDTVKNKISIL
jgi:hypothetical protein